MFHSKINKKRQAQMISLMQALNDCPNEEKPKKNHSIKMLMAQELLDTNNYVQAMSIFSQLNIDSSEVIKLIPELDNKPGKNGKIKGEDLKNALKALVDYLILRKRNASEASGQYVVQSKELELIDVSLMKCYLHLNDRDSLTKLLRHGNCKLEEAERILSVHEKYMELVIFYQTRGQHRKALQLLKEHDRSEYSRYMTIEYLQQLGPENLNLIFEFSDYILQDHPKQGLKIFTAEEMEVENLPRQKILDYLLQKHKPLVVPYLEHIIHAWNENNSLFHDELINLYREGIMDKESNSEAHLETKSKLLSFLEKSSHYNPEIVIRSFPTDSLFEERAAILERLGRHEQALNIYINILGDVNKAVRYCEKTYDITDEDCRDVYIVLLQFLLNPQYAPLGVLAKVPRHPRATIPDIDTALSILEKHVDKISPVKALEVLPDTIPLARLNNFLQNAMHNQLVLKRKTQVKKGLLYAETIQVEELIEYYESNSFVVDEYNACRLCKKRFRNQNALMRCPNGNVVHYSCGLYK